MSWRLPWISSDTPSVVCLAQRVGMTVTPFSEKLNGVFVQEGEGLPSPVRHCCCER